MDRLDVIVHALDAARRFPRLAGLAGAAVGACAEAAARVPVVGQLVPRWLPFVPRLLAGAPGLTLHRADERTGELTLGGAREVVLSIAALRAIHDVVIERLGEHAAAPVLYEIGRRAGIGEVLELRRAGGWFPPPLAAVLGTPRFLERLRADWRAERVLQVVARLGARAVLTHGGVGNLVRIDVRADPIEIELDASAEAKICAPSAKPVCHIFRGTIAGWARELLGEAVTVEETACAATGARRCVFLLRRTASVLEAAATAASPRATNNR